MTGTASRAPDVADDAAHGQLRLRAALSPACAWRSLRGAARPSRACHLAGAPEGERVRGHVLGDRAARADVGALADRDRRHERRVAADEGAGLDRVGCLFTPS